MCVSGNDRSRWLHSYIQNIAFSPQHGWLTYTHLHILWGVWHWKKTNIHSSLGGGSLSKSSSAMTNILFISSDMVEHQFTTWYCNIILTCFLAARINITTRYCILHIIFTLLLSITLLLVVYCFLWCFRQCVLFHICSHPVHTSRPSPPKTGICFIVLLQLASRQNERLSDSFDAVHISSEDLPHFYFPVLQATWRFPRITLSTYGS